MALGFRFRLEVIRQIRRREREAQRRVVADAVGAVSGVEERIEQLSDQLRRSVDGMRESRRDQGLDVMTIRGQQVYSGQLQQRIIESYTELTAKRETLDKDRRQLAEATKRLKVIEKLRDKQWARYMERIRAAEQSAVDEAAMEVHRRRQGVVAGEVEVR